MLLPMLCRAPRGASFRRSSRCLSSLPNNPHIYTFPSSKNSHILSLLSTNPPSTRLCIGTTTEIPPTPTSLRENPYFLSILHSVLAEHAASDPLIQGQAAAFASSTGSFLGSRHKIFPRQRNSRTLKASTSPSDGGGGTSSLGGTGNGGRGGWVHVTDLRAPPDYGRIAWPEDIFGSLEVDGRGEFVKGEGKWRGRYQESGSYRLITREGILGLGDFLRGKLIERLLELEKQGGGALD